MQTAYSFGQIPLNVAVSSTIQNTTTLHHDIKDHGKYELHRLNHYKLLQCIKLLFLPSAKPVCLNLLFYSPSHDTLLVATH